MKQALLIICSIVLIGQLNAQDLSFDISPLIINNIGAADDEVVGHSIITNTATAARNLKWTRNIVEMSDGWFVAICDKNQCFDPTVTTMDFNLDANEGGTMDVHIYPNGNEGRAIIEVVVQDLADTTLSISNLYYFNAQPSSTNELSSQSLKVYPNPSNGLFTVNDNKQIDRLDVFSLTGKKVDTFTYGIGQWYNIAILPKGTYLVRLVDRNGQQMATRLINKM